MKLNTIRYFILLLCISVGNCFSQLLVSDQFANLNGGTGFTTAAWNAGSISTATPLTYAALNSTPSYVSVPNVSLSRTANGIVAPVPAATWISFLLRSDGATEAFLKFYNSANSYSVVSGTPNFRCYDCTQSSCGGGSSTNSLSVGKFATGWGVKYDETGSGGGGCTAAAPSSANATSATPANTANGQTVLVVMQIGASTLNVYINPQVAANAPAPTVTLSKPTPNFISSILLNSFYLVATGGTASFDEVRVGTSFPTVVPPAPKDYLETIHAINGINADADIKTTGFILNKGTALNGKVLTSDANGVASWTSFPAGSWQVSGNNLYNTNTGNVGIGVSNPGFTLSLPADNASISLGNNIFINGQGGTGRISNNAYLSGGNWAAADATAKASTIELRDNGTIEMYGSLTNGANDFRLMLGIDAPNNKIIFPNGKVGISASIPDALLHIGDILAAGGKNLLIGDDAFFSDIDVANILGLYGNNNSAEAGLKLGSGGPTIYGKGGYVGIGTSSPISNLHVNAVSGTQVKVTSDLSGIILGLRQGTNPMYRGNDNDTYIAGYTNYSASQTGGDMYLASFGPNKKIGFVTSDANYNQFLRMEITNGRVNIFGGVTPDPAQGRAIASDAALSVYGTIYATKVVVTNAFADYVFQEKYKLISLDEVEKYIKENKHLPNMPSASDIEANGMNMGDIIRLQMEKIEELTLHMIEMKKQLFKLQGKK